MRISNAQCFLTLQTNPASQQVRIERSLKSAIQRWCHGTRVSPIWGVIELGTTTPKRCLFDGQHRLMFLGPINPALLLDEVDLRDRPGNLEGWVTAGLFNILVRVEGSPKGRQTIKNISDWAGKKFVPYEIWDVEDGLVKKATAWAKPRPRNTHVLRKLSELPELDFANSLNLHVHEFSVLMASSVSRAAVVAPKLHDEFCEIAGDLVDRLELLRREPATRPEVAATIVNINAALSRLSSQCFAGISPILSTECHFWLHSLLGIGTANLALANLVRFISSRLGDARLPERFERLKMVVSKLPATLSDALNVEFLRMDHLGDVGDGDLRSEPTIPLITYFSGRDGYSSQLRTISAPLNAIGQANSFHSNLLTVTHELSHVFVEGMLGQLYPDPDDQDRFHALADRIKRRNNFGNMMEVAEALLVHALLLMDQSKTVPHDLNSITGSELCEVFNFWRRETKEIIVHAFDYTYFFFDEPSRYVKSIWLTWSSIPGIADRIPEYVLRTLSAISPAFLALEPDVRREKVKSVFCAGLEDIANDKTIDNDYASRALDHIKSHWDSRVDRGNLRFEYEARLILVRIVVAFMHSERIRALLFEDLKAGNRKKRRKLDSEEIHNPIPFVKEHLEASPDPVDALWLLHQLAYCLSQRS